MSVFHSCHISVLFLMTLTFVGNLANVKRDIINMQLTNTSNCPVWDSNLQYSMRHRQRSESTSLTARPTVFVCLFVTLCNYCTDHHVILDTRHQRFKKDIGCLLSTNKTLFPGDRKVTFITTRTKSRALIV